MTQDLSAAITAHVTEQEPVEALTAANVDRDPLHDGDELTRLASRSSEGRGVVQWTEVQIDGTTTGLAIKPRKRRGRKLTVKGLHPRVAKLVRSPAPRDSVRLMVNGKETPVLAGGVERPAFEERVQHRQGLLEKRGYPHFAELTFPQGQASLWYDDVIRCVPKSGRLVAKQVARLCGNDSRVTISIRSLADAVGVPDRDGRLVAFTERGIQALVESGWLRTATSGSGQNIITTFYLLPGDVDVEWFPEDDDDWLNADWDGN